MPNMWIFNLGKERLFDWMLNQSTTTVDTTLRLFQNNMALTNTKVAANFTEADFSGYTPVTISRGSYTITLDSGNNHVVATYTSVPTFTCDAGPSQTIYGWYLTDNNDGIAICGQEFATPRVMDAGYSELIDPFKIELYNL